VTGTWREVITRAGDRCECRGACGRKHKDGGGRCAREHTASAPLAAVPREPAPTRIAAALPAAGLHALCRSCHDGLAAAWKAERAAGPRGETAAGSLF
jgi:hypothetical protein